MSVLPNNLHGSTTFSPRITSYELLADKIKMMLGAPLVQIEISDHQMYTIIDTACEYFTKFAGTTEEFLIFRSDLYIPNVGLPIDRLINITPDLVSSNTRILSAGWDFDRNSYRKVVDVYSFNEGNNSGINTLFTIEHTIAQQAYFGHLLGNVGYDLVTWQALKNWIDLREKVLAMTPYLRFYPETQMLKIIPEPSQQSVYYGLVACHMEKAIKDLVSQLWVYRYSLALTKMTVAHTRGKFGGTTLFGGQTVSYQDLMSQGIGERDRLEEEISKKYIDTVPPKFFIG